MKAKKSKLIGKRRRHLKQELMRIKNALIKLGAKKIILFGSFSRGFVGRTTDIDLLVIKDTDATVSGRLTEIYNNIIPEVGVDILVYTQDELDKLSKSNIFVRKILKEGKVICVA